MSQHFGIYWLYNSAIVGLWVFFEFQIKLGVYTK